MRQAATWRASHWAHLYHPERWVYRRRDGIAVHAAEFVVTRTGDGYQVDYYEGVPMAEAVWHLPWCKVEEMKALVELRFNI